MEHPIIFFDGNCLLCNRSVQFILRNDTRALFHYSIIGSDYFFGLKEEKPELDLSADSVLLYTGKRFYTKSAAALRIAWKLRFPWPLLTVFVILPPFIRDGIYDLIARKRYQWFGRSENCIIPSGKLRERIVS